MRGRNNKRLRLILASLLLMSLLSGCARTVFSECPAPEVPTWTPEESQALAEEIQYLAQDGKYPMTLRALKQCYSLRKQIRACQ